MSEDPLKKLPIRQSTWRKTGLIAVLTAGVMAWCGAEGTFWQTSWWFALIYWGTFFLALFVAGYCALLDFRYIRLQYLLEQQAILRETFTDPAIRAALKKREKKDDAAPES